MVYIEELSQNKANMSVTPDVSHVEMWPYIASAAALSESHAATAVLMVLSSSALPATASNKLATHRSAAAPIIVACCSRWAAASLDAVWASLAASPSVLHAASLLRAQSTVSCKRNAGLARV